MSFNAATERIHHIFELIHQNITLTCPLHILAGNAGNDSAQIRISRTGEYVVDSNERQDRRIGHYKQAHHKGASTYLLPNIWRNCRHTQVLRTEKYFFIWREAKELKSFFSFPTLQPLSLSIVATSTAKRRKSSTPEQPTHKDPI